MRDQYVALTRLPDFPDEEQARVARIQQTLLHFCLGFALIGAIIDYVLSRNLMLVALIVSGLAVGFALFLLHRRRLDYSIYVLLGTFVIFTTVMQLAGLGIHDTVTSLHLAVLVVGSMLLRRRPFILLVIIVIAVNGGVALAEAYGLTRSPLQASFEHWLDLTFITGMTAVATRMLVDSLQQSRAHARIHEAALEQQAESLRESEHRYQILTANLPDSAFLVYDHDLRFVLVDGPEVAANGYARADLEGRLLHEALPASFAIQVEPNMRAVLTGKRFSAEFNFGDRIHAYNYVPLTDRVGRVVYGMILARNITEQRRAEAALQASEAQLRMLADNMVDTITQVDAALVVVYVSPSAQWSLGLDAGAQVGRSIAELMHPADWPRIEAAIRSAVTAGQSSLRLEYRLRRSETESVWLESEIRLLYNGHSLFDGAVLGSRDITKRKRIEFEREQLIAELEAKNVELERFTYTVSHDLRSPLITIQGFLGYLDRDARAGDIARLTSDINRISAAVRRMERLLNDLLALSRVGQVKYEAREIPFNAVVTEALELVAGRIHEREARITVAPRMPVVYGDRSRLVEVMQNLVDNALKFSQPRASIEIGARYESTGQAVCFVRDDGIGIEPLYHEQVFGLFNKLDPRSEGVGVGLAIVRRIIDTHGGRIWVESNGSGAGATFYFTLPAKADSPVV